MKTKQTFFLLTLLLCLFELSAQQGGPAISGQNSTPATSFGGNMLNYSDVSLFNKAQNPGDEDLYANIEGTPFLTEEFVIGRLLTTDGKTIVDVPMKINLYENEVIAESILGDLILLDEKEYQEIVVPFEGRELLFKRVNSEQPSIFYEVLFENPDFIFLKEWYVTIKEGKNYGMSKTEEKFSLRKRYFVVQDDGPLVKTRLKKKSILEMVPKSLAREFEVFAEQEGLGFGKEADVVSILKGVLPAQ